MSYSSRFQTRSESSLERFYTGLKLFRPGAVLGGESFGLERLVEYLKEGLESQPVLPVLGCTSLKRLQYVFALWVDLRERLRHLHEDGRKLVIVERFSE